ncbi:hypothetical protein E4T56_gene3440 [Termitomyces sp. T112]|nr:hypothetical protein E4T56_gene3440 [Termitomyces sp. T112]
MASTAALQTQASVDQQLLGLQKLIFYVESQGHAALAIYGNLEEHKNYEEHFPPLFIASNNGSDSGGEPDDSGLPPLFIATDDKSDNSDRADSGGKLDDSELPPLFMVMDDESDKEVISVTTRSPKPRTSSIKPPNPQKTPNAPPNFRPCPAPTSANSDTSPANSNGPLANFSACPAATDTYPGPPKPREPPPLFPIFATHHQLNTLVPLTYFGVSRQPRGNPRSPMIPSMYQRSMILGHN